MPKADLVGDRDPYRGDSPRLCGCSVLKSPRLLRRICGRLGLGLAVACTRYAYVPLTPASCPNPPGALRALRIDAVQTPGLHGRVVSLPDSAPLGGAQVSQGSQAVATDAAGRFALPATMPGLTPLRVRRVGFRERVDTLAVPDGRGLDIVVPMTRESSPLVECEIKVTALSYRRRKPWWKLW